MLNQLQELSEELRRDHPSSDPQFKTFPSGAAMLDVKIGPETYVIEYLPSLLGIGISESSTATFGWEGCEHSFDTFEGAKEFLLSLLATSSE